MTQAEANRLIGRPIHVKHKISGETFDITLASHVQGPIYKLTDGSTFIITGVERYTPKTMKSFVHAMSPKKNPRRLPQWVKDKGFHSWKAYMDSIRSLKGKRRRKVSAKSRRQNPRSIYEVIVGNIGTVYTGTSKAEAIKRFNTYVAQSKSLRGRAGGESVTIIKDGEPIKEHFGEQDLENHPRKRKRNPESIYDEAVKILESNLRAKIREIKRQGTVGMSTRNLKQIVSTKGLRIPPSAFDRAFNDAIERVRRSVKGFEIYEANPRRRKRNPVAVYNPKAGKKLPVSQVEIRYKRTDGRYNGKYFRHPFASSVSLYGLSDGSIKIKSNSGKKLWGTVD
jgi:hypothetical protein